jgi:predicted N-acyltransferase
VTQETTYKMKSKAQGLGDKVAAVTKATGIEKIVKTFFGEDCGCDERRERLNKMFSRPVKMMDEEQRKFFEDEIMTRYKSGQNLTKHIGDEFYKLYEELLNKKKKRTTCTSCNKNMYIELLKIYESSCDE